MNPISSWPAQSYLKYYEFMFLALPYFEHSRKRRQYYTYKTHNLVFFFFPSSTNMWLILAFCHLVSKYVTYFQIQTFSLFPNRPKSTGKVACWFILTYLNTSKTSNILTTIVLSTLMTCATNTSIPPKRCKKLTEILWVLGQPNRHTMKLQNTFLMC